MQIAASSQVLQAQGKLNEALQEYSTALEVLLHASPLARPLSTSPRPPSHCAPTQVDGGYGPRAWEVYMKMGELLQGAGDWQQAKEAFDQATMAAPHEVCLLLNTLFSLGVGSPEHWLVT